MQISTPAFLKSSKPSSTPNVQLNGGGDHVHINDNLVMMTPSRRPLTRLQNPFRRSTSSPAPHSPTEHPGPGLPFTSPSGSTATAPSAMQQGIVPAHLDQIGLRLAEAASKVLLSPSSSGNVPGTASMCNGSGSDPALFILKGRKPLPAGRGTALGKVIHDELGAASSDLYLYKAILRVLQKPLTVLLSNVSSLVFPLLDFIETCVAAQEYVISLATLSAELLEALNGLPMPVGVGKESRVGDGLKSIREGLESIIKRVVSPLVSTVSSSLSSHLDALSGNHATGESKALVALAAALPGAALRLAKYTVPLGVISQSALATLHIRLVWRALVALSERDIHEPVFPGDKDKEKERGKSTPQGVKAKKDIPFSIHMTTSRPGLARGEIPPSVASATTTNGTMNSTTPPVTPRSKGVPLPLPSPPRPSPPQLTSTIPSSTGSSANTKSRSPTLPILHPLAQLLSDAQHTLKLLSSLPSPAVGCFAREAVNEAYEAFEAFLGFLRWLRAVREVQLAHGGGGHVVRKEDGGVHDKRKEFEDELDEKTEDVPTLVALPLLLCLLPAAESVQLGGKVTVGRLVGMEEEEYRTNCLAGFGRAEVCTSAVGRGVLAELAKVKSFTGEQVGEKWSEKGMEMEKGKEKEREMKKLGIDVEVLRDWLVDRITSAEAA